MKSRLNLFLVIIICLNVHSLNAQFKSIRIGSKVWMNENLKIKVPGSWAYNEDATFEAKFGRLYSWDAAKNACPTGWHLPSNDEWTELVNNVGGEDVAGAKLKMNGGSGFNAPLGGYANGVSFWFAESYGGYWSASSYDNKHAWYRYFTKKDDSFTNTYFSKHYGFSVRCVKDN
jgi:uncharacterized protein (TIGR02145 family)